MVPSGARSAFYFAAGGAGAFYSRDYAAFSSLGASFLGAFKTYLAPSSILKLQWQGGLCVLPGRLVRFHESYRVSVDR